jgi:hypothetical protein
MWNPTYDTTKENAMTNILIASTNTRFFLSGHIDVSDYPTFLHHGNVLEAVAPRLSHYPTLGILTFDNHRAAYHHVRVSEGRPIILLTSPIANNEISGLDVFNEQQFSIRALVFQAENVTLKVSGAVTGILEFERWIHPGVGLWSLPVELRFGLHTLIMSGDWNGECHFTTGNSVPAFMENGYIQEASTAYEFLFAWLFCFAAIITVPVEPTGIGESFDRWLGMQSSESQWTLAIVGGFLVIKKRIRKMKKGFQWALFVAVLWPIGLPIAFFRIEEITAVLWLWGYTANGKLQTLFVGAKLAVCYLVCVITPVVMMASAGVGGQLQVKVVIVDIFVYIIGIAGNGYFVYFLMDLCGTIAGLTSPMFMFMPIVLNGLLWWSFTRVIKEERTRMDAESLI